MRKLTRENLMRNKLRTIVTIIGIMLSVALLTVVAGIASSVRQSVINVAIQQNGNNSITLLGEFTEKDIEFIKANRNVEDVYMYAHIGTALYENKGSSIKHFLAVEGITEGAFADLGCKLAEGRMPQNSSEIVLSPDFALYFGDSLKVGDTVTLSVGERWYIPDEVVVDTDADVVYTEDTDIADTEDELFAVSKDSPYFAEQEQFIEVEKRTFTVTGILRSTCTAIRFSSYSASVPVYTVFDVAKETCLNPNDYPKAYLKLTDEGESQYIDVLSTFTDIDAKTLRRYFNDRMEFSEVIHMFSTLDDNDLHISSFNVNRFLLAFKGIDLSNGLLQILYGVAAAVILIIIFASVFIIRNSFSISITEKTRLYGMLSSVGATPRQICTNVLYESFLLGIFGTAGGLLLGIGVTNVLVWLCNSLLGEYLNGAELVFSISWLAVAAAILLGALTIFLSSLNIALRASRISPIEAIRGNKDIRITGKKKSKSYTTPKFIKRFFGAGGNIAWKNLKRSRKKYRTTVVSIIVSVVVYIIAFSFIGDAMRFTVYQLDKPYNLYVSMSVTGGDEPEEGTPEAEISDSKERLLSYLKTIAELPEIESDIYCINTYVYCSDFSKNDLDPSVVKYFEALSQDSDYNEDAEQSHQDFLNSSTINVHLPIIGVRNEIFREIAKASGYDYSELRGKGLFNNTYIEWVDNEDGSSEAVTHDFLKSADNYLIHAYVSEDAYSVEEDSPNKEMDIAVAGAADKSFISRTYKETILDTEASILVDMDTFMSMIHSDYVIGSTMYIKSTDAEKTDDTISKMFSSDTSTDSVNYDARLKVYHAMILVVEIFIYGFIAVITLIGITNIFNTINTNMKLRSKEFAMLLSVGMTKQEFNRMIRLESLFYTVKSLLIALPLGIIGSIFVNFLFVDNTTGITAVPYEFPWLAVLECILAVLLIIILIMDFSIRQVRKQNIIETIRNENV